MTVVKPPYRILHPHDVDQGMTDEQCPHCGKHLFLMNYVGGLILTCKNMECPYKSQGRGGRAAFFYQKDVDE